MRFLLAVFSAVLALGLGVTACGGGKAEQKADPKPTETAAQAAPPDAGPPAPVIPDPCDLFGQNCPDTMACALAQGKAQCGAVGAVAGGQPCAAPTDCAKGLVCTPEGCRTPCDDAHKCAEGNNCTPLKDAAAFSVCVLAPPVVAPAPAPVVEEKKPEEKKGKGKKGKK